MYAVVDAWAAELRMRDWYVWRAGGQQYTLRSLPGEEFSGLALLCLEYVGFKLTHPEIDMLLPFDAAYRAARAMYGKTE